MNFNLMNLDMLKEVANIGTGNAATSLSSFINKKITMNVPTVKMPDFSQISEHIGGPEAIISGLMIKISGDIDGMIMYLMPEKSACNLARILLSKNKNKLTEFDSLDESMLTEIGNILTSSYITALSTLMGYKIKQSLPYLSIDMAGAILSVPAIEFGRVGDKVLFIESGFNQVVDKNGDMLDISGYFMFIPNLTEEIIPPS